MDAALFQHTRIGPRAKLCPALAAHGVAPHLYDTAEEARAQLPAE